MATLKDKARARRTAEQRERDKINAYHHERVMRALRAHYRAADLPWQKRFAKLQAALLAAKPHLGEQKHCGMCSNDGADLPRHRVVFPNGDVIYSTWYTVPTHTLADSRRAFRENKWLLEQARHK